MKNANIELERQLHESTANGDRFYEELQNLQKVVREFSMRIPVSARVPGSSSSRNGDVHVAGIVRVQEINMGNEKEEEGEQEEDKGNVRK